MLKRTFWFTVGSAAGLGSSYWVQRRVKQAAARFTPEGLQREVTGAARSMSANVKAAVAEGREAARDREAELTEKLNGPSAGGTERPSGKHGPVRRN